MTFDVAKHYLVPKHTKLNDTEKTKLVEKFSAEVRSLPKISKGDPAIAKLGVKSGDIIKIERASKTAGTTTYYRAVIDE